MQDRLLIPEDKVMVWEFSLLSSSVPVLLHTPKNCWALQGRGGHADTPMESH